jgi:hypothetical protein
MKTQNLNLLKLSACLPFLIFLLSCQPKKSEQRLPMTADAKNALDYTLAMKPVYDSILIDDMESRSGWYSPSNVPILYTSERSIDGTTSLRLEYPFRDTAFLADAVKDGSTFHGDVNRVRLASIDFEKPQDWSGFDRLSIWIYVEPQNVGVVQNRARVMFARKGIPTSQFDEGYFLPEYFLTPKAWNYMVDLKPGKWNHITWEFPEIERSEVTGLQIMMEVMGHGYNEQGTLRYDIDRIQLQQVNALRNEGWQTQPGKIAFSHTGYYPGGKKVAVTSDPSAGTFQLLKENGTVVLEKATLREENSRGSYKLLDFSEITEEGVYYLKAGNITTRTFRIAPDIYRIPAEKVMNYFFVQRCGFHVPGIHDTCHKDWQGIYNGEKKIINGGWHDAGDMCQGSHQSGLNIYAMLEMVNQLSKRNNDPELLGLVKEEAEWGLDWFLRTRFSDGYRINWSLMRIFTDNIIGTNDDVVSDATNVPWYNFMGSGIEGYAGLVLKDMNPELAAECLKVAEEDWGHGMAGLPENWEDPASHTEVKFDFVRMASWGAIASTHLFKASGEEKYKEAAAAFGRLVMACQETSFVDGSPVTGYFHNTPGKNSIIHYTHQTWEESPLLALYELCTTFNGHPDWINWYGSVVLHSEYFMKRGAAYSSPFYMIPSAVYALSELNHTGFTEFGFGPGTNMDETARSVFRNQILEGEKLSDDLYLKRFPVQMHAQRHGSTAIQLSESTALSFAYKTRNDRKGEELVNRQVEWILGSNPFSQSLMYGEGYDFHNFISISLGNIVGSVPVGMDCLSNDEPYWPTANNQTRKSPWCVPAGRFLWNLAYVGTPALLKGSVSDPAIKNVAVTGILTGKTITVKTGKDGKFSVLLPQGDYLLKYGDAQQELSLLNGCEYSVVCDPSSYIVCGTSVTGMEPATGKVNIRLGLSGKGSHHIKLFCFNGTADRSEIAAELVAGEKQEISFSITLTDLNKPWVALIVPDNDYGKKVELTGDFLAQK